MEREKHPMGHRSCVLGPQVVGDRGRAMDSMAAAGPSNPSWCSGVGAGLGWAKHRSHSRKKLPGGEARGLAICQGT